MQSKIHPYDNYLIGIFIFFLPFTQALTIDLKFPLKISELAIILLVLLFFFIHRFHIPRRNQGLFLVISMLFGVLGLSVLINMAWEYPYRLYYTEGRFGKEIDSLLKFIYVGIAFTVFLVSSNIFANNRDKYVNIYINGALLAASYSWYLFASSLLSLPYLALPGMEPNPQRINLIYAEVIRSGTFKEGNMMGLFLFLSAALAFYQKRFRSAYFLTASVLTTFSTMAFICTFLFVNLYFFRNIFRRDIVIRFFVWMIAITMALSVLINIPEFRSIVLNKVIPNPNAELHETFSRMDRLNQILIAGQIALDNPLLGVGIANYGLHYTHYNTEPLFAYNFKAIPNNIYFELLSEGGFIALFLFLIFLIALGRRTLYDRSGILSKAFLLLLLYFLAYPTFTLLFVWVFFGLLSSLGKEATRP